MRRDHLATLPECDGQRAAEITSRPERKARLATRAFLRELLAERLGSRAVAAGIVARPNEKPRLARGQVEFSLSHADGWCAVALSSDCAVGVDVEPIRPLAGLAGIVDEFFPGAARGEYLAAPPTQKEIVFFRWWTRIEAAVEASGLGLDHAEHCFDGVMCESCDVVPGLALAVAAVTESPLLVDWHVP